jgi:DNA-binding GntR family transcriptional regulator
MAYLQLRSAILEGRLKPGQALLEEQLASDFDISRTPLREALAMLKHDGLVEAIPYRGTFVSGLTAEEYLQSMQVRERLEGLAIELAIDVIPNEEIERVSSLIRQILPSLRQGDLKADMECQTEFHGLAPLYSGNQVLVKLVDKLEKDSTRLLRCSADYGAEPILASADEHLEVLNLYRKRDCAAAVRLMTEHLRSSAQRALGFITASEVLPVDEHYV